MPRNRLLIRSSLAVLLAVACLAAMIFPLLGPARAASQSSQNQISAPPGALVISSFRFKGPANEADEYVELFNRSCSSTPLDLTGYVLASSAGSDSGVILYTFPAGTTLAAGQYFLLGGPTYAATATVLPDASYTPGIDSTQGGVALFASSNTSGPAVDAVGFSGTAYIEGTALTPNPANQTYVRKSSGGKYVDINNNNKDFVVDNTAVPHKFPQTGTCGVPTQTISGNTDVPNVSLTYKDFDNTPKIVTSDASGNYSITIASNWSGTITPALQGYTFTPASYSYSGLLVDSPNQDFTATQATPTNTPLPFYGNVVINEISWAGTSYSSDDQWIELYNTRPYPVDIGGWTLRDSQASIGTNGTLTFTKANSPDGKTEPVIPAHGYFVIASNKNVFQNLTPDYIDPNLALPSCSVLTYCGDDFDLRSDQGALIDTANGASYHWLAGSLSNHRSMERGGPNGPVPDSLTAWLTYIGTPLPPVCSAHPNVKDRNGSKIQGTPGCPNWASIVTPTPLATSTPYRYKTSTPYPPTPYGHMVINEFLPRAGYDWNHDGVVDVYDEFVELKNLGPVAAQLNGWKIDVISPGGPSSYSLSGVTLQPDQRVVFYSLKSHLSLYDSGGTIRLINARGVIVDARSYGAVASPDQSTCRIPDGFYWRFPCFPTPGNENSLTGTLPVPPPVIASQPPPCLLADTVPEAFKQAECYGFGEDVFNPAYWDDQAGFNSFPVPDVINKNGSAVR